MADGYRQARIDVIAQRAGVSVGTVYRYVEGKEALFELVVRHAAGDMAVMAAPKPFRAGQAAALVLPLRTRLTAAAPLDRLRVAVSSDCPMDGAGEFAAIVRAVYHWYVSYGDVLSLIAQCARDRPELAAMDDALRRDLHALLTRYVDRRMAAGMIRSLPDANLVARAVTTNCAAFAAERDVSRGSVATHDATEVTLVSLMSSAFLV